MANVDPNSKSNNFKLKEQLQQKELELQNDDSVLGVTLLTNPGYISSSRSIMFTLHMKQFVNLNLPQFPKVFTNYENMIGKYSTNYLRAKSDCVVHAKVPRFTNNLGHLYTLFTYDPKEKYYDVVEKKLVEDLTEKFGFAYTSEVMDGLHEGNKIRKGEVLYKSLSYDEDMNYCYGLNATVIYLLDTRTIEDAAVCSESFSRRMSSKEVETVEMSLNDNDVLLNLYGDKENYKCFPDIGELTIDNVVCAKRRINNEQMLFDLKRSNLRSINPTSDTPEFCSGKILDIIIYCNKPIEEVPQNDFNKQILRYLKDQKAYYTKINKVCGDIIDSGCKCSDTIKYLYRRSSDILDPNYKWRADDGGSFSHITMEFLIERDVPLTIGSKITGTSGDKSVISAIVPDEEMPYITVGNDIKRTEVMLNALGVVNRLNSWQLYQLSITFICNVVVEKLQTIETLKEKETLLFDIIQRFNESENDKLKAYYSGLSKKKKLDFFDDLYKNGIYIHIPPLWENSECPLFDKLHNIYKEYPWLELKDVYDHIDGRPVKMFTKPTVGEKYIIKMKQNSKKGFSARATGTTSKQGLPSKSNKAKINLDPWSKTPIRIGIDENINMCIGSPSDIIAKLHLFYRSSPIGRKGLSKELSTILKTIKDFKYTAEFKNRNVEILQAYLKCLGYALAFSDEIHTIKAPMDDVRQYTASNGKLVIADEIGYEDYEEKLYIRKNEMPCCFLGTRQAYNEEVEARLKKKKRMRGIYKINYKL
jgi:hypothetical protein